MGDLRPQRGFNVQPSGRIGAMRRTGCVKIVPGPPLLIESIIIYNNLATLFHAKYSGWDLIIVLSPW